MDVIAILLYLVGAAELVLGVYIGIQKPMSTIRASYTWVVFGTAGWVLANAVFRHITSDEGALLAERFTFIFGIIATAAYLYFSFVFPMQLKRVPTWKFLYVILSAVTISLFALFTNFLVVDAELVLPRASIYTYGSLYIPFLIWFFVTWIWSLTNFARKYRGLDPFYQWQVRMILFSIIVPIIMISVFDLLVPYLGIAGYGWVGSMSSIIWLGFSTYIVVRR